MNTAGQAAPADILRYLSGRQEFLVSLLERMTLAESPSDVPGSQGEIREIIALELEQRGFAVKRVPGRKSGGMLHARPAGRKRDDPAQMILGHYDTVWPIGTLAEMPFESDGEVIRGPGVYDMKGGVAQALMAIDALQHFALTPTVTPHVFLNSDEEIGSRESRRYIEKLAPEMDRVFVLEPSLGPSRATENGAQGHRPLYDNRQRRSSPRRTGSGCGSKRHPRTVPRDPGTVRPERPGQRHHGQRGNHRRRSAPQRRCTPQRSRCRCSRGEDQGRRTD